MIDISTQETHIYSQVFGPSIEENIVPDETTSYPDDTYGELVNSKASNIPWGWISFTIIFFIILSFIIPLVKV